MIPNDKDASPGLSPGERAKIERRIARSLARLKGRMADAGNRGIPHATFVAGWDGERFRFTPALRGGTSLGCG